MFTAQDNKKLFRLCSLVALCALLAGCGPQPSFRLQPLKPKTTYDQLTKDGVTVRLATCSRQYIRELFGKQGDALLGLRSHRRIIPIQITIENNSDQSWMLCPYDIRLPLADFDEVKARFTKAAATKGLASYVVGTAGSVMFASFGAAASILHPIPGTIMLALAGVGLITIPLKSHRTAAEFGEQNAYYKQALEHLALREDVVVHPQETVNKLIFVERKYLRKESDVRLRIFAQNNPDHTMLYNLYLDPKIRRQSSWC